MYFNLSSGPGSDLRGPWNSEPAFQYVADPLQSLEKRMAGKPDANEMQLMDKTSASGTQPKPVR